MRYLVGSFKINNDIIFYLESQGQRSSPPLELVLKHARYLRQQLASAGIGSAPFVDPNRLVFERNSMDL